MKAIVCVDDGLGMLFNHRRQSQDVVLRERILGYTAGSKLWMNHYSEKQFDTENAPQINVDDSFLAEAVEGDYTMGTVLCIYNTNLLVSYSMPNRQTIS